MKKLNLVENEEIVNNIKGLWSFTYNCNLIHYYIDDTYLCIYSRVTRKGSLYLFESETEKNQINVRIDEIKKNMKDSKVSMYNFAEIKNQSKAIYDNNTRYIKKGVYRKDPFFKGFLIQCNNQKEQREYNEFYNVLPQGHIFRNKWGYNFEKYAKIKELVNVWSRDDLLLMDNDNGEVVDKMEAIKRIKNNANIEIGYMNSSRLVTFENYYWSDGDILSVDDFVYCEDTDSLIDCYDAVWCDDVNDYRHIDDAFRDFHGNIYGSDDDLIYSEEKGYYIYSGDAVRIYEDTNGTYFWAHCDDVSDYYFWESDDEYHTDEEEENRLMKRYGKTRLSKLDSDGKPYFIGIELEMELEGECQIEIENRLENTMEDLNEIGYYDNLIEYKEDGSLEDGVEMVTAPTSLKQFKKDIVPLIQGLKKEGFTSEKGGRCGNHIHISRNAFDEQAQARLILIYAKFESIIKILSRRNGNTSYCKDVLDTISSVSLELSDIIVKSQKEKPKSTAINFNNSETIEFRVFRGTMNTNVLIANIQLVQLIADLALQDLSIQDILDLTFSKLIQKMVEADYKELIQYCEKKELL